MMLLTKQNRQSLPDLYTQERVQVADQVARVKFFTPDSEWTWYAIEFDGHDRFFGWAGDATTKELGYFTLSSLKELRGKLGLPVERDRYFRPVPVSQLADVAPHIR